MAKLTSQEERWLARVQKALDACPSKTLGFYTTGDNSVAVYRKPPDDFCGVMDGNLSMDFCQAVEHGDAGLGFLNFPTNVHSTAG